MFTNNSFATTIDALQIGLGASTQRMETIGNNLSNVNTPNFKRSEVTFEGALAQALQGGGGLAARRESSLHMRFPGTYVSLAEVTPLTHTVQDTTMRTDGNNVDPDKEMANLTKNVVLYNALTSRVGDELKNLGTIISEAGRR